MADVFDLHTEVAKAQQGNINEVVRMLELHAELHTVTIKALKKLTEDFRALKRDFEVMERRFNGQIYD